LNIAQDQPPQTVRLVSLDTSQWAKLAFYLLSSNIDEKRAATKCVNEFTQNSWIPVITFHHLMELLQHRNDKVVRARMHLIRSIPLVAVISSEHSEGFSGSVFDLLTYEVLTVYENLNFSVEQIQEKTRSKLFKFIPGFQAVPEDGDIEFLRLFFEFHSNRNREIVAITRTSKMMNSNTRLVNLFNGQLNSLDVARQRFLVLEKQLKSDIARRGDQRISDPAKVARDFYASLGVSDFESTSEFSREAFLELVAGKDFEVSEVNMSWTLLEFTELQKFRQRLRAICEKLHIPWDHAKTKVTKDRLPSYIVQTEVGQNTPDVPVRSGSELPDLWMASFSPYVEIMYVDKRTAEAFRKTRNQYVRTLYESVVRKTVDPLNFFK
jgi:hypothetical protein